MTFALTRVKAYGIESSEPLQKRFWQCLELDITGANTDVAYDFGACTTGSLGTFWTAVSGTEPGKTALKATQDIQLKARAFLGIGGPGIFGKTAMGANGGAVTFLDSTAGAGGSATATATVTGLATTDTILGVTQKTKGANGTALNQWTDTSRTANQLAISYTADPGAGSVIRVAILKAAAAPTPVAGQYTIGPDATNTNIPDITFASGDAPTSSKLVLTWELNDGEIPDEVLLSA